MLVCGVKVSHDAGVAVIDDDRLLFSVEIEKVANGRRYSTLGDLHRVADILRGEGIDPAEVDQFVVDGWWAAEGVDFPAIATTSGGEPLLLPVAPYVDGGGIRDCLRRYEFPAVDFGTGVARQSYASYHHASNHALGSYCTSPFAAAGADSLVLVWDGGIAPRLYQVSAAEATIRPVAPLLPIVGNIFPDFCGHFAPFHKDTSAMSTEDYMRHHLEIAGKAMAYAALGSVAHDAFTIFDRLFDGFTTISMDNAFALGEKVVANREELLPGLSDADIIATFQAYLGDKLHQALTRVVSLRFPGQRPNLCMGGGCALNIKWNSLLRTSGLFADIWIPPFPNDSGAAIGTACCEMFGERRIRALRWDVYQGPRLATGAVPPGWTARPCDARRVAEILHLEGEPIVVLAGRAELGPRALGNRSILAPAVDPTMKSLLNDLKGRADYRPVAPICLESRAAEVFNPGSPDRYMLFEHRMRPGWAHRVPAIVHLDGSARLQTLDPSASTPAVAILTEYERLSGIPVLCNTSANFNGHGFFPDAAAAMEWGRTRYVWADGTLYTNPEPIGRAAGPR
jgi:carbamoyltransferase